MESTPHRSLALIVAAAVITMNLHAAPASSKHAAPRKKATPAPHPPETPFDTSVTALPAHFRGNSVIWVLARHALAPKGEFESTAAFDQRVAQFQSATYAFVPEDQPVFEYNADTEEFTAQVHPSTTSVTAKPGSYFRVFNIQSRNVSESKFVGSNAFGAKVLVKKTKWISTQVVTEDWDSISDWNHDPLTFKVRMPPDIAKAVKARLRVLYVCKPRAVQYAPDAAVGMPFVTGFNISNATVDDPVEYWAYYIALRADLVEMWIFDDTTGGVYARLLPTGSPLPG